MASSQAAGPISVAVLSRSFSRHAILRQELLQRCCNVTFNDGGVTLSGADLIAFLTPHDAAIVALERIDAATLESLPKLRTISKF